MEPIDYFGGEDGFGRQLERDARKRELCLKHDTILIEVLPGYTPDAVIHKVRATLAVRGFRQ